MFLNSARISLNLYGFQRLFSSCLTTYVSIWSSTNCLPIKVWPHSSLATDKYFDEPTACLIFIADMSRMLAFWSWLVT